MKKSKTTLLMFFITLNFGFWTLKGEAQYTQIYNFSISNGGLARGELISVGNYLYGMTARGGTKDSGVVFKIHPDGTGYTKLVDFIGINGNLPYGSLFSDGTFLYGMTYGGGINNMGIIFKIKTDGTSFSKLLDFDNVNNGANPGGSLFYDGTFLYAMTYTGGSNLYGTIIKIKTDGTGYSKLHDFGYNSDGGNPLGTLISDGTFLYGITRGGGLNYGGTIFKIKPDGTSYSSIYNFDFSTSGMETFGSLFSDGTFLYAMPSIGGVNQKGTIIKIKPDGTGFSVLHNFGGGTDGTSPWSSLISDGTFLYGIANGGGVGGSGTIFKIKPDGTNYSELYDFSYASGAASYGALFSDGTFLYGMAELGGPFNYGVIFKFHPAGMGIPEINNQQPTISLYPNPFTSKTIISFSEVQKNSSIKIIDMLGKVIKEINFTGKELLLEKGELNEGIYFVQTIDEKKHICNMKIVVQ